MVYESVTQQFIEVHMSDGSIWLLATQIIIMHYKNVNGLTLQEAYEQLPTTKELIDHAVTIEWDSISENAICVKYPDNNTYNKDWKNKYNLMIHKQ